MKPARNVPSITVPLCMHERGRRLIHTVLYRAASRILEIRGGQIGQIEL